jgi:hypothetical protein
MLQGMGFSLQGNAKVVEGKQHADRDAQFRYLAGQVGEHAGAGQPVVSVDTKRRRTWASSRTADGSTNRPGRRNV